MTTNDKEWMRAYKKAYNARIKSGEHIVVNRRKGRAEVKPEDLMLRDFLLAKTPQEKREVIKSFNPYYFTLTPSQAELKRRKAERYEEARVD